MKKIILVLVVMFAGSTVFAGEYVQGYTRSDGTYVAPYNRSTPDSSYNNNYSVRGNINPYTGSQGTEAPTYNNRSPEFNTKTYGSPQTIPSEPQYRTPSLYRGLNSR